MISELELLDETLKNYTRYWGIKIEQCTLPVSQKEKEEVGFDNIKFKIGWRVFGLNEKGNHVIQQYGRTLLEAITGFNKQYNSNKNKKI